MEGVAYHLRWICEAMEKVGFTINSFNGIGGGCNSTIWVQIISDVTGRKVHVVKNHLEAGAAGTALTVAVGMGVHKSMDDVDQLVEFDHSVNPIKANQKRYDDLYHEYRELYSALTPIYKRLYKIK